MQNILKKIYILIFVSLYLLNVNIHAYYVNSRKWIGLDVFSSFLAADQKIDEKNNIKFILIILTYIDAEKEAHEMAEYLEKRIRSIKGKPIKVEITDKPISTIKKLNNINGVFLSQRYKRYVQSEEKILKDIIYETQLKEAILFSPFEGDVERGCLGGLTVSDIIIPYINMLAKEKSKIKLQKLFLKIAEQYPPTNK